MSVPSRAEAAAILLELDPPPWLIAHSAAVAEIAAHLAERIAERGTKVNAELVEAAALLHDVDKTRPLAGLRDALDHGAAGAAWLAGRGHAELGPPVANHPATRLADDAHYAAWTKTGTLEEQIVAYADKRAMQDLVEMDARYDEWLRRFPTEADTTRLGRQRAQALEQRVCGLAGIHPGEVRRLGWVDAALTAARSAAPR